VFYVALAPGSFFDPGVIVGQGTSHGSAHLYDRTVPLLVRAPGRVAAGRVVEAATFNVFTSTAAALLGIAPPADGVATAPLGL
jgi:arylsulfatase A-like enzyme